MDPSAFESDLDAYLAYLDLERGLSRNTRESYQRDLGQCAAFLARRGVRDWRAVKAADAAAWVRSLSRGAASSQARKLTALRMFARFMVRERLRPDDFTALLSGPKLARRLPESLTTAEVGKLLASPSGGDPASLRDRASSSCSTPAACGCRSWRP
jgi:integrase/recombinase XerD